MAITLNFPYRGLTVPNAYIRVDHVRGGKRENRIVPSMVGEPLWYALVGVYAEATQPTPLLEVDLVIPFITDQSPFPALYEALKLLPEFAGATDC